MSIVCTQLHTTNVLQSFFSLYDSVKCKSYEPKGDSYPGLSLRMLHELFDRLSFATAFTPELLCETRCSPLLRVQYALFEEVQYENRRK